MSRFWALLIVVALNDVVASPLQVALQAPAITGTGDNARHDNDPKIPRTPDEIYALNRAVAAKMRQIFSSRGIPVVPSLGPNSITNEFAKFDRLILAVLFIFLTRDDRIWDIFIPFPYLQVFQRGAYYSAEVIPDEVAAISLNTLYFYDSNKAVGGCGFHDRNDPGNLEFDWLEVQLRMYRQRNMQFSFLESIDLEFVDNQDDGPEQQRKTPLYDTLMEEFAALPKKSEEIDYSDYAVVNTAPPVVPNPYLPSFRIFVYNVTGRLGYKANKRKHGHKRGGLADKTARCRLKENRDTWKCFLNGTWNSDPGSPSRSNKQWTPLGYAQYYLPDLEKADKKREPEYKLEYVTFAPSQLHPAGTDDEGSAFRYPIPLKRLPKSLQNSSVTESKFAPYSMADLTIPSWVELAQRLGNEKQEALRAEFRKYMYMGGEEG
ncbi:hypothetical protein C0989_000106 [Termitomyces sp. Mn162]|nr:hypothetical protein C0989_000106 [Termitomyces sp. Mn162]